ncbi:MAG: hypothetical protein H6707_19925 [Deltaproteobacteria bacterium]|nr:hypothetical protein [Deltaproteobacteria bacterium]
MRRYRSLSALLLLSICGAGCAGDTEFEAVYIQAPPKPVAIESSAPTRALPGAVITLRSSRYLSSADSYRLLLEGRNGDRSVSFQPALSVDGFVARFRLDDQALQALGDGTFRGSGQVRSTGPWGSSDGPPFNMQLEIIRELQPVFNGITDGSVYLNQKVVINVDDILLEGEGQSSVVLRGCFVPTGQAGTCPVPGTIVVDATVPVEPQTDTSRKGATFLFSPSIGGIKPGRFSGTIALQNAHDAGSTLATTEKTVSFDLQAPTLAGFAQQDASLGQYLDVLGTGFIGGTRGGGGVSAIAFSGEFVSNSGAHRPIAWRMVAAFKSGDVARYVIPEEIGDGAEKVVTRKDRGQLIGQWKLVSRYGDQTVESAPVNASLRIAPVKQVVHLRWLDGWERAMAMFGMTEADPKVREIARGVLEQIYAGVNLELRDRAPEDFRLYSTVDVVGRDPNNTGSLLGLDNSPGKDRDNRRLFDHIGGANATTLNQGPNGSSGYGGVFGMNFFVISEHPPPGVVVAKGVVPKPMFDEVFDKVRPDTGTPISADEMRNLVPLDGLSCPASSRPLEVACAVRSLGNMIGVILAHEIGHSLGLSKPLNPSADAVSSHNSGDEPYRLMDSGRPVSEYFALEGKLNAFCVENYQYLRRILPSTAAPPPGDRPPCDPGYKTE